MKLLVFNCHEAWVYQLGKLEYDLDIIVGLKGRYTDEWDERMRPLPANAKTISLPEALEASTPYHSIICHNITDLLDVKTLPGPRIIVLHSTLAGRLHEERSEMPPEKMKGLVSHYLELVGGHAVAISPLKGESWGFTEDIVTSGADPEDYLPYTGEDAKGLRICNEISKREKILYWDFHVEAFDGVPMQIVGYNPDMPGVEPARNWDHLKQIFSSHRFYVHTADPQFEDGFNMATLEAMAAGMPILGNRHPTSPVEHGISGFLSDDPHELRSYAKRLIADRDLAAGMGEAARKTVAKRFSMSKFKEGFNHSIEIARRKWERKQALQMGSVRTSDDSSLLIVQVEPPQQEDGGDYYYRTYAPGIAMSEEGGVYVINLTNVHRKKEEIMRLADVLVLKNICDVDILPLIKERKEQKKLNVYELADDLCAVPPWNPVHFFYKNPENLLLFKRIANYCDAMQFSVPELKKLYGYLNPSSDVFINQISIVPPEKNFKNRAEMIIGWGGSHGHLEDIAEMAESLIDWIISKDNVQLYLMCSETIWSLFDRLPQTRKQRFNPGSLEVYYAFLKKIDIGLIPLKDTAFNRSRSDVKFLEYAVHGVVPVIQSSVPYVSTVKHGESGFLFEDTTALLNILGMLTENVHLISKVGLAARNYVIRERLQHNHGKERVEFYREKLGDPHNRHEDNNRAGAIFESFSNIEGSTRKGRHLRLMPTRFENLLHDGLVLGQVEGKKKPAHSLFSDASQLEPKSYMPYLFGASCSGDATGWFDQSIGRNPRSVKSWVLLGEEYAKRGDIVRSIKCFESAAEIFPEYEIPYMRTASLLQKLGHQKESIQLIEKAEALILPLQAM